MCAGCHRVLGREWFQKGSPQSVLKPGETPNTSLTLSQLEHHNSRLGHGWYEDIEKMAEDVQSAARSLGFELPPGWRVGGLDDIQKSPMDRWLEGQDIIASGRRHPGEGNGL